MYGNTFLVLFYRHTSFDSVFARFNLDPDNKWPDERLWQALESVQMKETVQALPEKLGKNGGSGFSEEMGMDLLVQWLSLRMICV